MDWAKFRERSDVQISALALPSLAVSLLVYFFRPTKSEDSQQTWSRCVDVFLAVFAISGSYWTLRWVDRLQKDTVVLFVPVCFFVLGAVVSGAFSLLLHEPLANIWTWSHCDLPNASPLPPHRPCHRHHIRPSITGAILACVTCTAVLRCKEAWVWASLWPSIVWFGILFLKQYCLKCLWWQSFLVQSLPISIITYLMMTAFKGS
jgi:hypothetical protein